jgi:hypothetical protein
MLTKGFFAPKDFYINLLANLLTLRKVTIETTTFDCHWKKKGKLGKGQK